MLCSGTVIWVSMAFLGAEGEDGDVENKGAAAVHSIVAVLEEAGLTVKRIGDTFEALERAKELKVQKSLSTQLWVDSSN